MRSKSKDVAYSPGAEKVENIQALRGIAALFVVWAHLKFAIIPGTRLPAIMQTSYGAIGVDIFFIISGYVISLAACKRHHQPGEFFLARIARVSPLYLAATLFFLGKDLVHHRYPTFQSAWNGFFYLPLFDWRDYSEPPLGPGWTLSFEMWFYTVFALLLNFWNPRKVALALPIVFSIGAVAMTFYHGAWYFPRFMFHPFTLEFALGCLVFHTQNLVSGRATWILLGTGLALSLAFAPFSGFLGWHPLLLSYRLDLAWERTLVWGLPSALVVAGLVGLERQSIYVMPWPLVRLGEISYSLYLTHLVSIQIISSFAPNIGLHGVVLPSVFAAISCLILAWLCWRWVEKPLTTRAQGWARKAAAQRTPVPSYS